MFVDGADGADGGSGARGVDAACFSGLVGAAARLPDVTGRRRCGAACWPLGLGGSCAVGLRGVVGGDPFADGLRDAGEAAALTGGLASGLRGATVGGAVLARWGGGLGFAAARTPASCKIDASTGAPPPPSSPPPRPPARPTHPSTPPPPR